MAKGETLECLVKLGLNLTGIVGGGAMPYTVAYYALGQPKNLYHELWLNFGDGRDFLMMSLSLAAATASFIGAKYLGEYLFEKNEK